MTVVEPRPKGQKRRKPEPDWTMAESAPVVEARSRGRCEHPSGCDRRAQVFHHKRGRGFAGCNHPDLIAHLCELCHLHTHAHPVESYANGAMIRRVS